ncbi:MAG TPA: hypothetical protein VFI65_14050 [Streptosporangiaceae bacterium]|nr:hypothetical protein [Streptosporangiaceae bacterium]
MSKFKHRAILIGAVGGALVLVLAVLVLHQVFSKAGTTKNFTLVSPPPASAGGFVQDVAAESQPAFKADVANFRKLFTEKAHRPPTGSIFALYQGQASDPSSPAGNFVVYIGFKAPESDDTSGHVSALMKGIASKMTNSVTVPVAGGLGDTSFECATGNDPANTISAAQLTFCGWVTDRTAGILLRSGPDPGAKKLSAIMLKMWPALVLH